MSSVSQGLEILALPLAPDCRWHPRPAGATVQDYLVELLTHLWGDRTGDNVSEYGMVGESDWHYDLYEPLRIAGYLPAWRDGWGLGCRDDGTNHPEDERTAQQLITDAIRALPYAGQAS